jgi:SAM-dependent methyltransferase
MFSSPEDPAFRKYIDTEAILYIREIQEVGVPFPPWQEMVTVGGETDLRLFLSIGHACYESVNKFISSELAFPIKVLDFGVGCARTMRFFYRETDKYDCYGCDVDRRAIDYINRYVPFINARTTNNLPPLPYQAGYFDIVYSISVFTHLENKSLNLWMKEMHRILKDKGSLELSLHGSRSFDIVVNEPQRRQLIGIDETEFESKKTSFDRDGFVWMRQPVGSADIDTSQFGISFISRDYLNQVISPYFTLIHYAEGELGGWQDLAVLHKVT